MAKLGRLTRLEEDWIRLATEKSGLRIENRNLRAELESAKAENVKLREENVKLREENAKPIDLSSHINAAGISAADMPHTVVEKLQRAIDAARGMQ